ncbi:hypothetical protein CVT25_005009 [Psilocybe cyanescens]|uniref:Nucleosome assembly protein n=1 Tax=Psilocybe cyanescens TaxID=93625 RepID=A0A409XIY7_PSICY|nr:hypothetical protein CVT25_005009 [Psilocybe cyanescens]
MSSTMPISGAANVTAPTPQNTPLTQAPIALGLSRPTVPDITEDNEGEAAEDEGPSLAGLEQHMLGMVQGKLADLLGKSSGYIESLPVEVKLNVEALKGVQVKQNDLHNQYKKECLELEKKYLELQKPLYERRSAIIAGKTAATTEEIEAGEQASVKDDEDYTPLPKDVKPSPAGIPEFWLTALRNHVGLSEMITDRDAEALKHLVDVRLEYLKEGEDAPKETLGKPGFKIIFQFEKNDYFTNEVLEKTYLYQEEVGYSGDFVYDRALGTNIKWKEDKDLTKEFEIKKQRNKSMSFDHLHAVVALLTYLYLKDTNRTRLVRKARPTESFFNFFSPPVPPTEEEIENGDYEEEELQDLEEKLEEDYQIGEDLKEKIIPRAIDYFTGKALEYEIMDEDDEDDYEDSEDGRGGAPAAGANVNPEECKNQ